MNKKIQIFFLLSLNIILFCCNISFAQGVRGMIKDEENNPIPFATIFIKQTGSGSSTNAEGQYEIRLKPGSYSLVFQHLGYQAIEKQVEIGAGFKEIDITLSTQALLLKEIKVRSGAEDPAYTIMRKAIAKSKYHTLQVQRYTAQVYTKGAGRVKDMPSLLEGFMEKKGVDSSTVYLLESVSEITFEQPNTIEEKVISVRSIGNDNEISPNNYINRSIYEPDIEGVISPLSPKAFAYYKFRYDGSFIDRGFEVNKIKVTPRSRGDNVYQGYIYIIENLWNIHSLNLTTFKQGFKINLRQIYAPVVEKVWMPVNHQIEITGKVYGFNLEFKYLATVSDYQVTINPDLDKEFTVIDEKIEEPAIIDDTTVAETNPPADFLSEEKPLTRKELKKMVNEYEKEMRKQEKSPEVVANTKLTVDSTAYKKDSAYWANIRPVPLNKMETNSYQKLDSMMYAEKEEEEIKRNGKLGNSLLYGGEIKLGDSSTLAFQSPLFGLNFNTVEGYNFEFPVFYELKLADRKKLKITPTGRYAFSRKKLSGKLKASYYYNRKPENGSISIEGGRYISQFNQQDPIDPLINSLATLIWERNYMKIYEKDFAKISWNQAVNPKIWLSTSFEWAERRELFNNTDKAWRDRENRQYSPNAPENTEVGSTSFPMHQAALLNARVSYFPTLKYYIRNDRKFPIMSSSPGFHLSFINGLHNVLGSDVNYNQLQLEVKGIAKFGARGDLQYDFFGGSFLNRDQLYFPDFQHFMGNRTFIQVSDPAGSYRLLDYYRYSTSKNYLGSHLYYQFRKFLLTQILEVRFLGLQENVFVNYLKTSDSPHYTEFGYSLDNIFRFLRLELVASFEDMKYQNFGFRIGIATRFSNQVRNNP